MKYLSNIIAGATLPYEEFKECAKGLKYIKLCESFCSTKLSAINGGIRLVTEPVYAYILNISDGLYDILLSTGSVVLNVKRESLRFSCLKKYATRFGVWDDKGYLSDDDLKLIGSCKNDIHVVDILKSGKIELESDGRYVRMSKKRYDAAKSFSDLCSYGFVDSTDYVLNRSMIRFYVREFHSHSRVYVEDEFGYGRYMSLDNYRGLSVSSLEFKTKLGTEFRQGGIRFFMVSRDRETSKCTILSSDGFLFLNVPYKSFGKDIVKSLGYKTWKSLNSDSVSCYIAESYY